MQSLRQLRDKNAARLYPAHGPTYESPAACRAIFEEYLSHRQQREDQIVDVLRSNGDQTARQVVESVYAGMSEGTWQLAIRPVASHLRKLEQEGRAVKTGQIGEEVWRLV
jgi:hypothetical protein